MAAFEIQDLSFFYPQAQTPAVNKLSLTLERGEFVTLCGKSGCGKTTLLRQLKSALTPHGTRTGSVRLDGVNLEDMAPADQSRRIGFVMQSPEQQIVTDKVWHELAFGLESLGLDNATIRLRVAEMASYFGIETWFYKNVSELSGGQKQLLNLASVMALQPDLLILDEPTSQLDPIAAADFLATVGKINRELGTTVLLTEHRLEEALPLSDRVVVMDRGSVIADGTPSRVGQLLKSRGHDMFLAMPTPMRIYAATRSDAPCPVTVREGRDWLEAYAAQQPLAPLPPVQVMDWEGQAPAVELSDVWFRYEQDTPDVVRGLSFTVQAGSFTAVVGGNGTGKSTTLSLISGLNRPHRGEIKLAGRPLEQIPAGERFQGFLGVLPQNPQALFVKNTVALDLLDMLEGRGLSRPEQERRVAGMAQLCELEPLLQRHPYDLSGGEQQRAALAKVLLLEPRILLLDEPTKGLDGQFKETLAQILKGLQADGVTILMVSHDVEFCAKYADRCAMFFDGAIVTQGPPRDFFSGNSFYTTAANRMARSLLPHAVTAEDVMVACGGVVPRSVPKAVPPHVRETEPVPAGVPTPAPRHSRLPGLLLGAVALVLVAWVLQGCPLPAALSSPAILQWKVAAGMIGAILCAMGAIKFLAAPAAFSAPAGAVSRQARPLSRRTLVAAVMIVLLIPLTLLVGTLYLGDRKYYFISLLLVVETMLPFFLLFESRKPQARELVVLATLCAIAVAGRAAFFFLPQFKPVAALVIVAAVAFGGEAGFLVGAVSMLASNLFFVQGAWTPFQMFAMGLIGFFAGVLSRLGILRRNRFALCLYGFVTVLFLYGFIMNTYSVFQVQSHITWPMIVTSCAVALPMDLVHALATVFFLWVAGPAMLEKLDRIKIKYGLLE